MSEYYLTDSGERYMYSVLQEHPDRPGKHYDYMTLMVAKYEPENLEALAENSDYKKSFRRLFEAGYIEKV